jgi:hypothetical protein
MPEQRVSLMTDPKEIQYDENMEGIEALTVQHNGISHLETREFAKG